MFRQSVAKPLSSSRPMLNRPFSALAPRMGEGDTGSPKPGPWRTQTYVSAFQEDYQHIYNIRFILHYQLSRRVPTTIPSAT